MTLTLLIAGALVAFGDWVAVDRRLFRIEYLLKPLTMVLLILAAISADLGQAQPWIVAGLVFGLLGDVGLMLADEDKADTPFLAGLTSFLIGHICYLAGFIRVGVQTLPILAGLLIVGGIAGLMLPQVLRGAAADAGRGFAGIVAAYSAVLGAMAVLAVGTQHIATAVGGVLFLVSDTVIARGRFVAPITRGPLLVIVTYHLAQFLIVLGLIESL
ncbi:MAG: lysoplasmalogenase [Jatrophihabitans sp.]